MFSSRSRQSGFNLLEVMVTLLIVAIVAAFAVPSLRGIMNGSQLSATSKEMVFSLQSARSEAIKRITPVSVCPSADPEATQPICGGTFNQGWIVFVDVNANGAVNAPEDVLIRRGEALPPQLTLVPDDLFSTGITFNGSGVSTNVAGVPISGELTLTHSDERDTRVISVAASGRISASLPLMTTDQDDGQ